MIVNIDTVSDQPVHQGLAVLAQLRRAGVPATGVLRPTGVEYGELRVTDGKVYEWVPGDEPGCDLA
jgi:hypothetical protein